MATGMRAVSPAEERWVRLAANVSAIPERLLIAHSRGEVLFVTGAGISRPSGLPDFRQLVMDVYEHLDAATFHQMLSSPPLGASRGATGLSEKQDAELVRFDRGDFDVVLGMLERRIDGASAASGKVRQAIARRLRAISGSAPPRPAGIHRALIRLSNRGITTTIATTNFDRLLQSAHRHRIATHSLGGIPRPSRNADFSGVLHIHGVLDAARHSSSDIVVTDRDFGEFYLRRRIVPDFIYDAARLFHLVLVGYSANDAPMRYLLNAVAADGSRFDDLKERFAFIGLPAHGDLSVEDWKGRGITPITYDPASNHEELARTLDRWAELSPINGSTLKVEALIKRLAKKPRAKTEEPERDLFDHLMRRASSAERLRFASVLAKEGAQIDWIESLALVSAEPTRESNK
jgi:hypothetical protein